MGSRFRWSGAGLAPGAHRRLPALPRQVPHVLHRRPHVLRRGRARSPGGSPSRARRRAGGGRPCRPRAPSPGPRPASSTAARTLASASPSKAGPRAAGSNDRASMSAAPPRLPMPLRRRRLRAPEQTPATPVEAAAGRRGRPRPSRRRGRDAGASRPRFGSGVTSARVALLRVRASSAAAFAAVFRDMTPAERLGNGQDSPGRRAGSRIPHK